MLPDPAIHVVIGEQSVSRHQVQEWETRRATKVLKKFASRLGHRAVAELLSGSDVGPLLRADLNQKRSALLTLKAGLGHAGIYAMLRKELTVSERVSRLGVAASRGRTKHSVIRLTAQRCSAASFTQWFDNLTVTNAEIDMIDACPDHYLLRGLPDGRQEVVETTGGSPNATRFCVDYGTTDRLSIPIHRDYPLQIAGHAVLDDGVVIGGVRHQFRDHDGAMEALLTVEFPAVVPEMMIAAHRWHLAAEFSNWVSAFARGS